MEEPILSLPGNLPDGKDRLAMKRFALAVLAVAAATGAYAQETQDKQYVVNAIMVETDVPVIDGTVSPGEWSTAATPGCTDFVFHNNAATPASEDPEVKALFDRNYLYILWESPNADFALAFDPAAGDTDGDGRDPSGLAFTGDDWEVFFFPNGPNSTNTQTFYHTVFFPNEADGICYISDEGAETRGFPGQASWDADDDKAAFTHNSTTQTTTIEYKIAWTSFNITGGVMTSYPADGTEWGIQLGFINNNPSEAVNWEPDGTAGFLNAEPYGLWTFTGAPPSFVTEAGDAWQAYD